MSYPGRVAAQRPSPWLRATLFAGLTCTLATVGHVAAGGNAPSPALLTGFAALVLIGARLSAEKERGWRPVMVGTIGVQLFAHALFALGGGVSRSDGWTIQRLWLCHQGPVGQPGSQTAAPFAGIAAPHLLPPATHVLLGAGAMLAAHAVAAVLLAIWLRHGELLAWRLAVAAAMRIRHAFARLTLALPARLPGSRRIPAARRALAGALLVQPASGRGPPVLRAA